MFYKHHNFTGEFQRFYGHGDGDGVGIGWILFVSVFNAHSHFVWSLSALSTWCQKVLKRHGHGKNIEKWARGRGGGCVVREKLKTRWMDQLAGDREVVAARKMAMLAFGTREFVFGCCFLHYLLNICVWPNGLEFSSSAAHENVCPKRSDSIRK